MSEPEALHKRRGLLLERIGQAADEIGRIDDRLSSILAGSSMSRKGKSRTRMARRDILRSDAANKRRRARQQARQYDRTRYDGSQKGEES